MPTASNYNSAHCPVGELSRRASIILSSLSNPDITNDADQRLCAELLDLETLACLTQALSAEGALFQISLLATMWPGKGSYCDTADWFAELQRFVFLLRSIHGFVEAATGTEADPAILSEYLGRNDTQLAA